jgi:hypothetical protein
MATLVRSRAPGAAFCRALEAVPTMATFVLVADGKPTRLSGVWLAAVRLDEAEPSGPVAGALPG